MDLREKYNNPKPAELIGPDNYISYLSGITLAEYSFLSNFFSVYGQEIIYLRQVNPVRFTEDNKPTYNPYMQDISSFYKEKNTRINDDNRTYYLYSKLKANYKEEPKAIELSKFGIKDKRDLIISFLLEDWKKLKWTLLETTEINQDLAEIYYPLPGDLVLTVPYELIDKNVLEKVKEQYQFTNINNKIIKEHQLYISHFRLTRPVYIINEVKIPESLGTKIVPPIFLICTASLVPIDKTDKDIFLLIFKEEKNETK